VPILPVDKLIQRARSWISFRQQQVWANPVMKVGIIWWMAQSARQD